MFFSKDFPLLQGSVLKGWLTREGLLHTINHQLPASRDIILEEDLTYLFLNTECKNHFTIKFYMEYKEKEKRDYFIGLKGALRRVLFQKEFGTYSRKFFISLLTPMFTQNIKTTIIQGPIEKINPISASITRQIFISDNMNSLVVIPPGSTWFYQLPNSIETENVLSLFPSELGQNTNWGYGKYIIGIWK